MTESYIHCGNSWAPFFPALHTFIVHAVPLATLHSVSYYGSSGAIGLRAVPEIILRGAHIIFSDPSTPRTHMESEPPDPQDT